MPTMRAMGAPAFMQSSKSQENREWVFLRKQLFLRLTVLHSNGSNDSSEIIWAAARAAGKIGRFCHLDQIGQTVSFLAGTGTSVAGGVTCITRA
jgi:hypothetical protein